MKSSYLKEILTKEYGQSIGFKERPQKNQSEWVYDVAGGGSYIDAAIHSTGISDEKLMENLCGRLHAKIKAAKRVPWPPRIDQLEEEEDICTSLIQLLCLLKHPNDSSLDFRPKTLSLASMITQYVTGQRTATCINLGVDLHGHTRSKELVDMWHRAGIIISYADVQLLYDKWALEDLNESLNVPREIAHGVATICIVDNDDFKIDTLTGKSQQAHRTNVMFVQPQRIERNVNIENSSWKNKAEISKALKQKAAELTSVTPYRASREVSSEPPIRKFSVPPVEGPLPQQRRSVIHALARVDCNGDRPEVDQQHVPSYSGMQACLNPRVERSKPYYQSTYPEPPSKSVMNDIMLKLVQGMKEKEIPFSLLVGDLPTYVHIVELKAENTESFKEIIPIFGPFHQQCSFIYAIYISDFMDQVYLMCLFLLV